MDLAAMQWTGTAERIILASAVVVALGVLWRYLVRPIWRFTRRLHIEVREEIDRRKKIDAIIQRELTHNGGGSIKDHTSATAGRVAVLEDRVQDLSESQKVTYDLLDTVVQRKAFEHDEIWEALVSLGIDRRQMSKKEKS